MEPERDDIEEGPNGGDFDHLDDLIDGQPSVFGSTGTSDSEVDPRKRPVIFLVAIGLLILFALPLVWLLISLVFATF